MLTVPNLPTDSLYKFIFVGGILLTGLAFYLQGEVENALITIEAEDELFNRQNTIDSLMRERQSIRDSVSGITYVTNDEIKRQKYDKSQYRFADLDTAGLERLTSQHTQIIRQQERLDRVSKNLGEGKFLLIIGGLMTTLGAFCWYRFVQKLQDELLETQVITTRIELKKLKDSLIITPEPDIKQLPESTTEDDQPV